MSAKAMRGILAASGMTHAALAERLETSRPRLTSYASGTMTPSADMFIDALNVSGVMRVRARAQTADSTAENITESDDLSDKFRWLLEELRVGLYAQELKTPMPVSVKRLQKIWDSRAR